VWSGSISFGLVNVPVKAYTAARDHEVHFHQLEKGSGARIRYEKVSAESGKPVDADDIELGYEISKGRYVTFERDELDDLRPESTRAVEVSDFVALDDIDPIYYERTYWLAPDGDAATKAYRLLLAAMEDRQRVGIGGVVMRNKQYLAAIRPLDGALAMSTMRFADEIVAQKDIDELPSRRAKPEAKALKLATQIIDSLEADWKPERYKDTYTEQLKEIIERKDKGEDVVVSEAPAQQAEVLDLMAALEASVSAAKKARKGGVGKALAKAAREIAADAEDDDAEGDEDQDEKAAKPKKRASRAKKSA
jgi:DNA end-binding protein Ku